MTASAGTRRQNNVTTRSALLSIGLNIAVFFMLSVPFGAVEGRDNALISEKAVGEVSWLRFSVHLPHGSRIDFFTAYFYDSNTNTSSSALLTAHSFNTGSDLFVNLSSSGSGGFGSRSSDYIGYVVDTETYSYVVSWFSREPNQSLRLCGARLEYRLPVAGGGWSEPTYLSVAATSFWPDDGGTVMAYQPEGCVSTFPKVVFSDGFENGTLEEWNDPTSP